MVVILTLFREYYTQYNAIEDKFPVDGLCWPMDIFAIILTYYISTIVFITETTHIAKCYSINLFSICYK